MTWTRQLADQLDWHWQHQLRPRLDGLTDAEYFWEPVADCWTVHRGQERSDPEIATGGQERSDPGIATGGQERSDPGIATVDFSYPPPQPEPFTTIAWRLAHVIVGVFAMRNHSHFAGPPADYQSWTYATGADTALTQLDEEYHRWNTGVRALTDDDLRRPCGPAEGPYADLPMSELVLHINREVIHHGAEIACLRDLYIHS
ncbi:DinB family protein [Mycobacterium sp. NBC_00419]|uniref:DinB family protein n=1 Tax=Mycobacterium sp. NBC_00419 TaxID=2975989 RepID=UPI002E1FDA37